MIFPHNKKVAGNFSQALIFSGEIYTQALKKPADPAGSHKQVTNENEAVAL